MEALSAGTQIGDYLVEELRATGGHAAVYRAVHLPTGRAAAIKLLHRRFALSPKALRRFRREVQLVDRLRHPAVVECYGFGEHTDGRPFMAMQWLDGPTLAAEIERRGRFEPALAAGVIGALCEPLAAAHAVGVVHRDLKASNVIAVGGVELLRPVVVDFGIAKLVDPEIGDRTALTTIGARLGSPYSMAPEQVLGREVDARTDIYALGVLLYQLVAGRPPFVADTAEELEDLHVEAAAIPPSHVAPACARLDPIVMRCLEKSPDRRYPNTAALRAALAPT